jgi:hypothetical protein
LAYDDALRDLEERYKEKATSGLIWAAIASEVIWRSNGANSKNLNLLDRHHSCASTDCIVG